MAGDIHLGNCNELSGVLSYSCLLKTGITVNHMSTPEKEHQNLLQRPMKPVGIQISHTLPGELQV